jgi:uncharacterized protein YjbI with pentapeptide repeats
MTNLRQWIYYLVATFILLLVALAAGQDTTESSCIWPHEGTVYDEKGKQIIQADEIWQCIKDKKDIVIDNALIKGVLDLSTLPTKPKKDEPDKGEPVTYIVGHLSITNSTFESDFDTGRGAPIIRGRGAPIIFEKDADFRRTTFTGYADFSFTTFTGYADFFDTTFTGYADFSDTIFTGNANFRRTIFTGSAYFSGTTFTGSANFRRTIFTGDAYFPSTTFTGSAYFSGTIFSGETNFLGMNFTFASLPRYSFFHYLKSRDGDIYPVHNDVTFSGATFAKDADFSDIAFRNVDFSNADFQAEFRLDSASVSGNACFFDSRFADLVSFWQFKAPFGKTVFTNSRFDGKVILDATEFTDIDFSPHADLNSCDTRDKTVFPPASFFDQVNFRNANTNSQIKHKANFQEVFFTDLNLSGSTFDNLILTDTLYNRLFYSGSTDKFYKALNNGFEASKTPDELENNKQKYDTLDRLRTNFKGFGQISMTNEAYYQKTFMEQSYDPETESKLEWRKLGFWGKVGLGWNYLSFYISGYFVKPQRAFWGSLLLIVFFGLIYFLVDAISFFVSSKKAKDKIANPVAWQTITDDKQRAAAWFEIARQFNTEPVKEKRKALSIIKLLNQKFWNALLFSFSKFTKIKLDRTPDKRVPWLETIEWTIGLIMLTSLTIAIANSVPGLERIVGAILPG